MKKLFTIFITIVFCFVATIACAWNYLAWDASIDGGIVEGYHIWYSSVSGGPYVQIAETNDLTLLVSRTDITTAIGTIDNGSKYYFVVSAFNEMGEGQYSNEVNSPLALPESPQLRKE